jgi:hypothetical protein
MRLDELFNDGPVEDNEDTAINHLRSQVMDYLTPLAVQKVESIPIQDIEDILKQARSGLIIDRGLIMQLLDPNDCKLVSKIEGDTVYITLPVADMSAKTDQDDERDKEKIANTASKVAMDQVGN